MLFPPPPSLPGVKRESCDECVRRIICGYASVKLADQVLWPRQSRFSGFVEVCLQTERRMEMVEAEVLCSESDNSGLSVSWNRDPVKTGGGRCIEWLRVWMVGSRVHVVLQSLSS